ncbi:hypothetical protein C8Q79DRAFT_334706 [Trametes meyenii]|nr:hypothetical protein C8Q79DRAFT_334706 [Trametes meyenii]
MFENVGVDEREAAWTWSVERAKTRRRVDSPLGLDSIIIGHPTTATDPTTAAPESTALPSTSTTDAPGGAPSISASFSQVIQSSQLTTASTASTSTSDPQPTLSTSSTPPPTSQPANTPTPFPSPTETPVSSPPPPPTTSVWSSPAPVSQQATRKDPTTTESSPVITVVSISGTASITTVWRSSEPSPSSTEVLQSPTARPGRAVNVVEIVTILVVCVIVLLIALLGCWLWKRRSSRHLSHTGAEEKTIHREGQRISLIAQDDPPANHQAVLSPIRGSSVNGAESEGYGFYPRTRDAVITPYLMGSSTSLLHTVARGQQFPLPTPSPPECSSRPYDLREVRSGAPALHPRCRLLPVRTFSRKNAPRLGVHGPTARAPDEARRQGDSVSRGWIRYDWDRRSDASNEPPPEYSRF